MIPPNRRHAKGRLPRQPFAIVFIHIPAQPISHREPFRTPASHVSGGVLQLECPSRMTRIDRPAEIHRSEPSPFRLLRRNGACFSVAEASVRYGARRFPFTVLAALFILHVLIHRPVQETDPSRREPWPTGACPERLDCLSQVESVSH